MNVQLIPPGIHTYGNEWEEVERNILRWEEGSNGTTV